MAKKSLNVWLSEQNACEYDRRRVLRLGRTVDEVVKAMRRPTVAQQVELLYGMKTSSPKMRRRWFNMECASLREWVAIRLWRSENGEWNHHLPWERFRRERRFQNIRKLADRLKAQGVR